LSAQSRSLLYTHTIPAVSNTQIFAIATTFRPGVTKRVSRLNRPECEANHSPPYNTEVKNKSHIVSSPEKDSLWGPQSPLPLQGIPRALCQRVRRSWSGVHQLPPYSIFMSCTRTYSTCRLCDVVLRRKDNCRPNFWSIMTITPTSTGDSVCFLNLGILKPQLPPPCRLMEEWLPDEHYGKDCVNLFARTWF